MCFIYLVLTILDPEPVILPYPLPEGCPEYVERKCLPVEGALHILSIHHHIVIRGSAGVGKTELICKVALEAKRRRLYQHIFWLSASDTTNIFELAEYLTPTSKSCGFVQAKANVVTALLSCNSWLLVVDDLDDPDTMIDFFTMDKIKGHTLATTRGAASYAARTKMTVVDFEPMNHHEARELFQKHHFSESKAQCGASILKLLSTLERLPSAIILSAKHSFIKYGNIADYIAVFENICNSLPQELPSETRIATTALLLLLKDDKLPALSVGLLCLLAHFRRGRIPNFLWKHSLEEKDGILWSWFACDGDLKQMLDSLAISGLVQYCQSRGEISVPTIIQDAVQTIILYKGDELPRFTTATKLSEFCTNAAVDLVMSAYRHTPFKYSYKLIPLASAVTEYCRKHEIISERLAALETFLAEDALARGDPLFATQMRKAYEIFSTVAENPTSNVLLACAQSKVDRGKYEEALQIYLLANSMHESEDNLNPSVAANMGMVFLRQGRYQEAQMFLEGALKVLEDCRSYTDSAVTRLSLGTLQIELHNYDSAIDHFTQALKIFKTVYGGIHVRMADAHHNLGIAYAWKSEWESAICHYKSALRIYSELRGENDPVCLDTVKSLVWVYRQMGDHDAAFAYCDRAIEISRWSGQGRAVG